MRKTTSFRQKIMLAFACFALIPALIVGLVASQIARENIVEIRQEEYQRQFQSSRASLNRMLESADQKILEIYTNNTVQNNLRRELTESEKLNVFNNLRSLCSDNALQYVGISMIGIYGVNGTTYMTNSALRENFSSLEAVQEYLSSRNITTINSWSFTQGISYEDNNSYSLVNIKAIRTVDALDFCGYMVTVVDNGLFQSAAPGSLSGGVSALVDEAGNVLYQPEEFLESETIELEALLDVNAGVLTKNGSGIRTYEGERYLINYAFLPSLHCYLINFVQHSSLTEPTRRITILSACIIALSFLVAIAVATIVMRSMMRPIDRLTGAMEEVGRGDLSARFVPTGTDEINRLGESLNLMIQSLEHQIAANEAVMKSKRESDRKLLQAQINPHLIYNSLNSLKNLAHEDSLEKLDLAIDQMAAFYRISLSSGKNLISVGEELQHVQAYIALQNICFGKHINLKIQVDESLYENVILKMTLQPIVENALIHGLAVYNLDGTITITGSVRDDKLILTVKDSGVGMDEETEAKLNAIFSQGTDISQDAFGLSNINSRILYYFGRSYGLHIESEQLEYTKVDISLPRQSVGGWHEKNHHSR